MKLKKNLVLTGMMGVGKSTVGKSLANKLSFKFKDIDKIIEIKEGCAIDIIFKNIVKSHYVPFSDSEDRKDKKKFISVKEAIFDLPKIKPGEGKLVCNFK